MQAAIGLAALLLVVQAASASAGGLEVTFQLPANFKAADATLNGAQWAILVFDHDEALFEATLDSPRDLENVTLFHPFRAHSRNTEVDPAGMSSSEWNTLTASSISIAPRHRSSIYIEASGIEFRAAAATGGIDQKLDGDSLGQFLRYSEFRQEMHREYRPPGDDSVFTFTTVGSGMPFNLIVREPKSVEWFAADIECQDGDWCPPGGGPAITRFVSAGEYNVTSERYSFEVLASPTMLFGGGSVEYAVFGGRNSTLELNGTVRLPLASGASCAGCAVPLNQTLSAEGHLVMSNVQIAQPGRLTADLGGDFQSARFDEAPIDPRLLAGVGLAGGAVIAAGAIVALKVLLGALFTKLRDGDVLNQPRRRLIYEAIVANPGVGMRELARRTELSHGVVNHHLGFLLRHDKIVQHKKGANVHFFENHGKFDTTWHQVAALKRDEAKFLHAWLQDHPNATQMDVVTGMAQQGWSRTATQRALERLVEGGVVSSTRQGRFKHFHALPINTPGARRFAARPTPAD